jgi:hypothetical protein
MDRLIDRRLARLDNFLDRGMAAADHEHDAVRRIDLFPARAR